MASGKQRDRKGLYQSLVSCYDKIPDKKQIEGRKGFFWTYISIVYGLVWGVGAGKEIAATLCLQSRGREWQRLVLSSSLLSHFYPV